MVLELVEKETLTKDDLHRILGPVRKRPPHNTFTAFGKRTPSDRPPVDIPTSLRKPAPNGSPNGHGSDSTDAGKSLPGVVPEPTMPQPPSGQTAVFGPQQNGADQPTQRFGPYGEQPAPSGNPSNPTQPYGGYPPPNPGE
jgi:cell division protease FtsH